LIDPLDIPFASPQEYNAGMSLSKDLSMAPNIN
jgi:hypothetical protein